MASTDAPTADLGAATWVAPNPFGEPTGYVLVHPLDETGIDTLVETAERLGLKRLDAEGDIMWVGTDTLLAALRARQFEFWAGDDLWMRHPVPDTWTGVAIARRYVVLVIGTAPLAPDPEGVVISEFLSRRDGAYTGLVKVRLKVTDG